MSTILRILMRQLLVWCTTDCLSEYRSKHMAQTHGSLPCSLELIILMLAVLSPVTLVQVIVGMPQGLIDGLIDAEFLNKGEKVDLPLCHLTASRFLSSVLSSHVVSVCMVVPLRGCVFRPLTRDMPVWSLCVCSVINPNGMGPSPPWPYI